MLLIGGKNTRAVSERGAPLAVCGGHIPCSVHPAASEAARPGLLSVTWVRLPLTTRGWSAADRAGAALPRGEGGGV